MNKSTGKIIIEWYDDHGHKEGSSGCESYIHAVKIAKLWESKVPGNNVIVSRVLYNTRSNNDKWEYKKHET